VIHRWVSGTGLGTPEVVPLVWKISAISVGVTSGRGARGREGAGRVPRSGMVGVEQPISVSGRTKSGSAMSALPPVFAKRSRMMGSVAFEVRTSGMNPARASPYM
jgi:hypothetical protein